MVHAEHPPTIADCEYDHDHDQNHDQWDHEHDQTPDIWSMQNTRLQLLSEPGCLLQELVRCCKSILPVRWTAKMDKFQCYFNFLLNIVSIGVNVVVRVTVLYCTLNLQLVVSQGKDCAGSQWCFHVQFSIIAKFVRGKNENYTEINPILAFGRWQWPWRQSWKWKQQQQTTF